MKLSRLVEIITVLLNKNSITAAELADRFNVSVRTIYRDVEVLASSGIPICTAQGKNGGISLMEDYTVNRTMLSDSDKNNILFALNSLQPTKYPEVDAVLEKLGGIFKNNVSDWISVDFTSWGSNPNANNKFIDIKNAIMQCRVIEIEYINAYNDRSSRKIEPLRLIFKSHAWYLWGYCLAKQDYRTFRISRIRKVAITDEVFDRDKSGKRPLTALQNETETKTKNDVHIVLQFTRDILYRLCDDYDDDQLKDNNDGTYTLELDFPEDEWVYGYILSFGSYVRVIEPEHIRQIISDRAEKIVEFYK